MSGFLSKPVVAACIVKNFRVLLAKVDHPEKVDIHNMWEFPGGKVDSMSEPLKEALVREIKEELDISVRVKELLHVSINKYSTSEHSSTVLFYSCIRNGEFDDIMILPKSGLKDYKWMGYEEIQELYEKGEVLSGAWESAIELRERGLI